jgi:hypothetical protein
VTSAITPLADVVGVESEAHAVKRQSRVVRTPLTIRKSGVGVGVGVIVDRWEYPAPPNDPQ